ncbi:transposase [Myxococcus fulvus]|uniref:transposase n=1 Tax=Myxococcus fulvus TaxID=33 RepID=UPI003B9CB5D0
MGVVPYADAFKTQRVKRMVGPGAVSAAALARQVGVSQPTLSQWLREANRVAAMRPPPEEKKPTVPAGPKKWTPEEKLRVLAATQGLRWASFPPWMASGSKGAGGVHVSARVCW